MGDIVQHDLSDLCIIYHECYIPFGEASGFNISIQCDYDILSGCLASKNLVDGALS